MSHSERFWLEDPRNLINKGTVLPSHHDSFEEKLNAVTRLVIIITIILAIVKWRHWQTFIVISLISIVAVYLNKGSSLVEHFDEDLKDFSYYKNYVTPSVSVPVVPEIIPEVSEVAPKEQILETKEEEKNIEELYTYWKSPAIDYVPKRNFVVGNKRK